MTEGVVFNVQRFSVHDGPGIRTTVFLKGCPLSCAWCHNPEGKNPDPELSLLPGRCLGGEDCVGSCPVGAAFPAAEALKHQAEALKHQAEALQHQAEAFPRRAAEGPPPENGDRARCMRCGACVEACPSGARTLLGESWTVESLMEEVERDRVFYEESGGGVTFSGGEPMMPTRNSAFLRACLEAAGERGLHRAVDTSGHVPPEVVRETAPLTDLFLYDLKDMDDERHRRHTGVGNERVLENLRLLDELGSDIRVRVPLIPGVNDDPANLDATVAFVASLRRPYPIHLLPYHPVGGDKYGRLGDRYTLGHVEPPAADRVAETAARLRAASPLEIHVGG